ncbi:hypothetical protein BZL39_I02910 [Zygosaccharomyces parabailii]|nr:hypothetical protein BZL39_I02910 [Zygosaccharomyces parabailii]
MQMHGCLCACVYVYLRYKMYFLRMSLVVLATVALGSKSVEELASSDELFDRLLGAQWSAILFVYSTQCTWCDQLALQLPDLQKLFPHIDYLQVDGQRANNFVQLFQITSYPQLLVFRPSEEADEDVRRLITGTYRGRVKCEELIAFLTQTLGFIPGWPHRVQPLERLEQAECTGRFRVLWFVTPWMEEYHQKLLLGPPTASLIDLVAQQFEMLDFFLVDSSQAHLAELTNRLRLTNFPTVVLMLGHQRLVIVELLCYDREIRGQENAVVGALLKARFDWHQLLELASKYHSVHCYESVQELHTLVQSQHTAEDDCSEGSGEWNGVLDSGF